MKINFEPCTICDLDNLILPIRSLFSATFNQITVINKYVQFKYARNMKLEIYDSAYINALRADFRSLLCETALNYNA